MDGNRAHVKHFLYGHYFTNGLRQSIGVMLPAFLLVGYFHLPVIGMVAVFGALCVSIIDHPGPHQHRLNSMLGCAVLGTLTVLATSLATSQPIALVVVVMLLTLLFGLFSAFGRKGALVGFSALLLMTLTMHQQTTPVAAAWHALATLGGALWYTAFSTVLTRYTGLWQERQALSVGLFATAQYFEAKAAFYEVDQDLSACYRTLVPCQARLAEKQQAGRDLILRLLPTKAHRGDLGERIVLHNLFIDMVDLHETMLATYTDYDILRRALSGSDLLLFARDALRKLAGELDEIGIGVAWRRPAPHSTLTKAELRAMEYEAVLLKRDGFPQREPEAWIVVVQILRRLRNASRLIQRMKLQLTDAGGENATPHLRMEGLEAGFVSRENFSLRRLITNFTLTSPHMRYALRLSLAVGAGLMAGWLLASAAQHMDVSLGAHGYWIILSILVIMRPGFGLSQQLNWRRLVGTLVGCLLTVGLMMLTDNVTALLVAMLIASILFNSLVQLNTMLAGVFNAMMVLLAFHFLAPGTLLVVGERALDAVIGSVIVAVCAYFLPYWENRSILPLARAAIAANRRLLAVAREPEPPASGNSPAMPEARYDVAWRLARRNANATFGNFADAYYRMMLEPKSKRLAASYLNDLLIQSHMLAAQISSLSALMTVVGPTASQPAPLREAFDAIELELKMAEDQLLLPAAGPQLPGAAPPAIVNTDILPAIARALEPLATSAQSASYDPSAPAFEVSHLTYELRQLIRSVERLREDSYAVRAMPGTEPRTVRQSAGEAVA